MKWLAAALLSVLTVAGCGSTEAQWRDTEVSFDANELTVHGSYRTNGKSGPAALLLAESGPNDRNGDNQVVGPVGTMRLISERLSDRGVASLRYDKVGTGKTGLGHFDQRPADVTGTVYTTEATAALEFLEHQPKTDAVSIYAIGEGAVRALSLAGDRQVHALGLLQPLPGRYLDLVTARVRADGAPQVLATWLAAVEQVRTTGTLPANLPQGLSAIINSANLKAVMEADAIDPVQLAAALPDGMPVLLTCSESDKQARCSDEKPLIDALRHTRLTVVELKGVNHVLRDDPTDNIANYRKGGPLSQQVLDALDGFVGGGA